MIYIYMKLYLNDQYMGMYYMYIYADDERGGRVRRGVCGLNTNKERVRSFEIYIYSCMARRRAACLC